MRAGRDAGGGMGGVAHAAQRLGRLASGAAGDGAGAGDGGDVAGVRRSHGRGDVCVQPGGLAAGERAADRG